MMGVWRRSAAVALAVTMAAPSGAAAAAAAPSKPAATESDAEPELDEDENAEPDAEAEPGTDPAGDDEAAPGIDPNLLDASEPEPEREPEADDSEPEPAEPIPAPPEPSSADAGLWSVRVRFVGGAPGELELFRLDPQGRGEAAGTLGGLPYTRVCRDPCEERVAVDPGDRLFVAGAKLMPSKTFTLGSGASEVELRVRPGPKVIRFAGFGLTVSGALLIPAGGLLVGAVDRGTGPDIAGFTLIGVGVVSLAIGIGLLVRGRTLVKVR